MPCALTPERSLSQAAHRPQEGPVLQQDLTVKIFLHMKLSTRTRLTNAGADPAVLLTHGLSVIGCSVLLAQRWRGGLKVASRWRHSVATP